MYFWETNMIRIVDGAMVPIATAIGNHDVGQEAFA